MNPRKETITILEDDGFVLKRHGSNHDVYYNPKKKLTIPVKRHDFDEDDKRYILDEAKIKKKKNQGKRKGQK